jgi:hypothetical protein
MPFTAKLAAMAAVVFGLAFTTSSAPAQSVQAFYLAGEGGLCVDVPHGRTQIGIGLIIWKCQNRAAQGFIVDTAAKKIRFRRDPNLCVDQSKAHGENRLMLLHCNDTWNDWVYDPRKRTVSAGGKCWDVFKFQFKNGTPMIAWRCHGGDNQKFVLNAL